MIRSGRNLTKEITANLVAWLRFKKSYEYVAHEVSWINNSDVLAIKKDEILEVEVKISAQDLKKELRKPAHKKYASNRSHYRYKVKSPTKFYICTTEDLEKKALKIIDKLNPKYGLIIFKPVVDITGVRYKLGHAAGTNLRIVKNARKLNCHNNIDRVRMAIAKRMSSALANLLSNKEWID